MARIIALPIAVLLLGACSTMTPPPPDRPPARSETGQCDAGDVQDRIGERATAELGAQLLALTGSELLRWIPPDSAVTMDYRSNRLNISYDRNMLVDRITCG